jgi:hypothetical protein
MYLPLPKRRRPDRGVLESENRPTIVFLNVCTEGRSRWLADHTIHEALTSIWRSATYWKVGPYILMPDHLHLLPGLGFCTQTSTDGFVTGNHSSRTRSKIDPFAGNRACFHHRLRSSESAEAKRLYMINDPVRAGLVTRSEEWPFQGQIFKCECWW